MGASRGKPAWAYPGSSWRQPRERLARVAASRSPSRPIRLGSNPRRIRPTSLYLPHRATSPSRCPSSWRGAPRAPAIPGWRSTPMRFVASVGGREHTVEVEANGHERRVTLDGREIALDWRPIGGDQPRVGAGGGARADHYSLLVGTRAFDAYVRSLAEPGADAEATTHTLEGGIGGRSHIATVRGPPA